MEHLGTRFRSNALVGLELDKMTLLRNYRPPIFVGLAYMPLPCEIINDIGISAVVCGRSSNGLMRKAVLFTNTTMLYFVIR